MLILKFESLAYELDDSTVANTDYADAHATRSIRTVGCLEFFINSNHYDGSRRT